MVALPFENKRLHKYPSEYDLALALIRQSKHLLADLLTCSRRGAKCQNFHCAWHFTEPGLKTGMAGKGATLGCVILHHDSHNLTTNCAQPFNPPLRDFQLPSSAVHRNAGMQLLRFVPFPASFSHLSRLNFYISRAARRMRSS